MKSFSFKKTHLKISTVLVSPDFVSDNLPDLVFAAWVVFSVDWMDMSMLSCAGQNRRLTSVWRTFWKEEENMLLNSNKISVIYGLWISQRQIPLGQVCRLWCFLCYQSAQTDENSLVAGDAMTLVWRNCSIELFMVFFGQHSHTNRNHIVKNNGFLDTF